MAKKKWFQRIVDIAASSVNHVDNFISLTYRRAIIIYYHIVRLIHNIRDILIEHRKEVGKHAIVILAAAAILILVFNYFSCYEYSYNGRVLGYVKNEETVNRVLNVASDALSEEYGTKISIEKNANVSFKRVPRIDRTVDNEDTVLKRFTYLKDIKTTGTCIYANGNPVAVCSSKSAADLALEQVKAHYLKGSSPSDYNKIYFKEKIKLEPVSMKITAIDSVESAVKKMTSAQEGTGKIPVTVVTKREKTYAQEIPFKVEKKDDSDIYEGDEEVQQEGVNGKESVTADVIEENGKEVGKKELKKTVIVEQVPKIVLVGTKEKPKTAPTGHLIMPLYSYNLTSGYGYRWGRLHEGLDLSAPTGTPIMAADGGTVVMAGEYGAYGLCVEIDHGGGLTTRYGHCSRLLVHEGEEVYQGQVIAEVGNTGRSYGSHCHFETRVNGSSTNPYNYL